MLAGTPPYISWSTAARDLQDAVDVSSAGDLILVTNGTCNSGSASMHGYTMRAAVSNDITIRSVNGPSVTSITGLSAIRCVYLSSNSVLDGFTVKNGRAGLTGDEVYEQSGGGIFCEAGAMVTNCIITDCSANMDGGGVYALGARQAAVYNCTVIGNDADDNGGGVWGAAVYDSLVATNTSGDGGGGCYSSRVIRCRLIHNEGEWGGGAARGVVVDSVISGNTAKVRWGGGFAEGTISNSIVTHNICRGGGGGINDAVVWNCIITDNLNVSPLYGGGGLFIGTAYNCFLARNYAMVGGGASDADLRNCTIVDNRAQLGGGTMECDVRNSIVYYNKCYIEDDDISGTDVWFSCTSEDPGGTAVTTHAPDLMALNNPHIASNSMCVNAGTNQSWMTDAMDIDGQSRLRDVIPDIGCDEVHPNALTGTLSAEIVLSTTNAVIGAPVEVRSSINGFAAGCLWDWGDGTVASNLPLKLKSYGETGEYDIVLTAWNHDLMVRSTVTVHVVSGYTNYVALNGNHASPFNSWANAATTIQHAVSANTYAGGVVLVTNGLYRVGTYIVFGDMQNRIAITNRLTVQSVNGPDETVIEGNGPTGPTAVRCAVVGNGAVLSGFTLTNGHSRLTEEAHFEMSGGGAFVDHDGMLTNCVITECGAAWGGAGVYGGLLRNCVLRDGYVVGIGGGASRSRLDQCELINNSATEYGGGTYDAMLTNCVLLGNQATLRGGGAYKGSLYNCRIINNAAGRHGGGADMAILNDCTVSNNTADINGGGVNLCRVFDSCIMNNQAADNGGGMAESTAGRCTIAHNYAENRGGGLSDSWVDACTIRHNVAMEQGGGGYYCFLTNCLVTANESTLGGGLEACDAVNCAVINNTAVNVGGTDNCVAQNTIIYYNRARFDINNLQDTDCSFCCIPSNPGGNGNITNAPMLQSFAEPALMSNSPCINAGTNQAWMATGSDYRGDARLVGGTVDIGPIEFSVALMTGDLAAAIGYITSNGVCNASMTFQAQHAGYVEGQLWRFGDGTVVTGCSVVTHAWSAPGDYDLVLTAWNTDGRNAATLTVHIVSGFTNFVSPSGSVTPPYITWSEAAHTIQDAVDANTFAGGVTLVDDGLYTHPARTVFGTLTNIVVLTNQVTLRSRYGYTNCCIQGHGIPGSNELRGVYLGHQARIEGFTVHQCVTRDSGIEEIEQRGGGICAETGGVISNCYLVGNNAADFGGGVYNGLVYNSRFEMNFAANGGGMARGRLWNSAMTNNAADSAGGGAYDVMAGNCTFDGNSAGSSGGGVSWSILTNCTLIRNGAGSSGGGVSRSEIVDCRVLSNSANAGGGTDRGTALECEITGNTATNEGGGCINTRLSLCTIANNLAGGNGGGQAGGGATNCWLLSNTSDADGGGASQAVLRNCAVINNAAENSGGLDDCNTENCTIIGNSAHILYGGAYRGRHINSIIYYNRALYRFDNWNDGSYTNCCLTPMPGSGTGNITNVPGLGSQLHPVTASDAAVIDKGTNYPWMAAASDLYGNQRISSGTVDIGCYEYTALNATGGLTVTIQPASFYAITNFALGFMGCIDGLPAGYEWSWGDGSTQSNACALEHAFALPGSYDVVLRAWNNDMESAATVTVFIAGNYTTYAATNGGNIWPYTNWTMAASTLQDAIDAQIYAGGCVVVTNGLYLHGGAAVYDTLTNRIVVTNAITVRGVNGASNTTVAGGGILGPFAVRCAWLGNNACLVGLTLTDGHTRITSGDLEQGTQGGGVWCASTRSSISNCVISGCSSARGGGGVYRGTLYDTIIDGNISSLDGGGANYVLADSCRITANEAAANGGGVADAVLTNCQCANNTALSWGGAMYKSQAWNCHIMSNNASLIGGGVYDGTLHNTLIEHNRSGQMGGGAAYSSLRNCIIRDNTAELNGGGISIGYALQCTIIDNIASNKGGGSYETTIDNSIIYYNSASNGPNIYEDLIGNCDFSCTTPDPMGTGIITNSPLFTDPSGGDLTLAAASLCIDAGTLSAMTTADYIGIPRPLDGDNNGSALPDMGAYEFVSDVADTDGDTFTDWQEDVAGTDMTDSNDFLCVVSLQQSNMVSISWHSRLRRKYSVHWVAGLQNSAWTNSADFVNVQGTGSNMTYSTSLITNRFYRVGVWRP
jgi:parallel beta-helix repeat protein